MQILEVSGKCCQYCVSQGGGKSYKDKKIKNFCFNEISCCQKFTKLGFPSKKAFSIAEAMVTLLVVSVALAAMAPIISKRALTNDNSSIPKGAILIWSGSASKVPDGFALCDGKNGTPDLRGRFLVGYNPSDSDYDSIGRTGGEKTHILTSDEMPQHTHYGVGPAEQLAFDVTNGVECLNNIALCSGDKVRIAIGDNPPYNNDIRPLTLSDAGGNAAHENRPPYYAIAYIMKK